MVPGLFEITGGERRDGHPDLRLTGQSAETRRQHADNRMGHAVESHRTAEHRRISAVPPQPEAMAEHRERSGPSRARLLGRERAPHLRSQAEHLEVTGLHELTE